MIKVVVRVRNRYMTRNNSTSSNTLCAQVKKHEQTIETLLKITKHWVYTKKY